MIQLANHLWQSTLFACAGGLLTLALRKNHARVRHWVWLATSLKFLIPLSLLVSAGDLIRWQAAPKIAPSSLTVVMDQVSRPFVAPAFLSPLPIAAPPAAIPLPAVLWGIWACGFFGIACAWWVRWRRILATVRSGSPMQLAIPIPAISSPTLLEPGIFGVFRPVLLLPEGIAGRLTPTQLQAVLTHELCHIRYRDNLIAAIHMFVETVFWFHPLVWWIGKRMVEERERACDEEVVRLGSEPRVYAEGILNICKHCVESPLACVAGVTGSNLKKRIEAIMSNRITIRLNFAQRAVLAVAATAAVMIPIAVGITNPPAIRAQSAKFEVASIKRCTLEDVPIGDGRGGGGGGILGDAGMFRTPCMSTGWLIRAAYYGFAKSQLENPIQGGPDWVKSERFIVEAKPDTPQPTSTMSGPMLRALLEDRFKLKVHRETRKVSAYALLVASGGSKLHATPEGGCTPPEPGEIAGRVVVPGKPLPCHYGGADANGTIIVGGTLVALCNIIGSQVGRDVIDKTGLTGIFDYHFDYIVPPPDALATEDAADRFAAVTEALRKLGLELKSTTGEAEFVVIDHVERPSEN
jgi:bla regulator protein BlaR1